MENLIIILTDYTKQLEIISILISELQDKQQRFLNSLIEKKAIAVGRDLEDFKINA